MQVNNLFAARRIEPKGVLVMRHAPREPELRKVLPWLAAERPAMYRAYQQSHWAKAEKAMTSAKYVASFIGHEPGKALFICLYRVGKSTPLSYNEYWHIAANKELKKLGMGGLTRDRRSALWFELHLTSFYVEWKGKLVISWPGSERSWWRWADRNEFLVHSIHEESLLDPEVRPWDQLELTWEELSILPRRLRSSLAEWRGIYFVFDVSDGKGYVGSACGRENLLGRWLNYAARGHAGNQLLRKRDPRNLRFSILERVSPDMKAEDVIRLEQSWKTRLHTRQHGLNAN